ncbi:hypothetical protein DVA67_027625 [Solirubrobacter sp. CPCC 204708]|uniref:WD40 repeat protein n=1 Tax=Solirubrobacter deserti TaxID=2282478 RepID=A0ABT4RJL2_9ACTN|nr:hypothetical protein [Solirubrobacter deserti]MBE2319770.1 hypothetical protein [Solirubrobacter deserti]MDA0138747.1 hypothetical protein [Solirubrobacter deserti]
MLSRLILAAGLLALAPAAANADSIVYVDQGNVWSAAPDGSHKVQLTTGGSWHSPTQADNGTIAAVQGTGPIQVMARDGRPLHTITTPPAKSGNGGTFAPNPVQLSFSPDGTKIAYAYLGHSCPPGAGCGGVQRSVFYTDANVTTATPHSVYGNQHSVSNPEWVTNTRTLVFGGFGRQVAIDDLDAGDYNSKPWMVPNGDMGDGEVTRDGTKLAVTSDYGENLKIKFFAVKGDVKTELPPAHPEYACEMTQPDRKYHDPTWAPDGAGFAWGSSKGIEVTRFTKFAPMDCAAPHDVLLTPTGTEPDWGPADPPAAAYTPPVTTPAPPTPAPTQPAPVATAPAKATLALAKTTKKALRKGLAIKVTVPGAGKVELAAVAKGKTLASGKAMAKQAGTVTVKLGKVRQNVRSLTLKLTFNGVTTTSALKVR